MALSKAASLSEDLVDEELLEMADHVDLPTHLTESCRGRRKNKDYSTSTVRRSVRSRRKPKKILVLSFHNDGVKRHVLEL